MVTISERMREAMRIRGMSQSELVRRTKIGKSPISIYLQGKYEPKQNNICKIAAALNVDDKWLMGYDVPMEQTQYTGKGALKKHVLIPITTQRIPLLSSIDCGEPKYGDESDEYYVLSGFGIHADFCLRAQGDSMIGARICDGDIVFIRNQATVDNGSIAAVILDNCATLKRVYYYPEQHKLVLTADNPKIEPLVYIGDELSNVHILGVAIAFYSKIE